MILTERQSQILKAIIEEHINCAQPIASVELVERRSLPVSGATVRNIMSDLVRLGYLRMMHVSSGRMPTDVAYKYYITELMEEADLSVLDEVALRQQIWEERYELDKVLRNSASALSDATELMGFAVADDGFITFTGTSRILDLPEFFEIDTTKAVLRFVDDYELAYSVIKRAHNEGQSKFSILIGKEIGLANMDSIAMVSTAQQLGDRTTYIGVIGPARMEYNKVIPITKYVGNLLEELNENL